MIAWYDHFSVHVARERLWRVCAMAVSAHVSLA